MKVTRRTRMKQASILSMRNRTRSNHTAKKIKSCVKNTKSTVVENFIELLNMVKIYHWNTHSFSQHKATDELHERLSEHIDKFVEILLGKREDRINQLQSKIHLVNSKNKHTFRERIYQYREYLIDMDNCFDKNKDTDLLNIRDEILGDINQFLYLLTFDK